MIYVACEIGLAWHTDGDIVADVVDFVRGAAVVACCS
jgi:hypothetical protein